MVTEGTGLLFTCQKYESNYWLFSFTLLKQFLKIIKTCAMLFSVIPFWWNTADSTMGTQPTAQWGLAQPAVLHWHTADSTMGPGTAGCPPPTRSRQHNRAWQNRLFSTSKYVIQVCCWFFFLKIWLQSAQRRCLKMLTHTQMTEAYLYNKLTNEPLGSGELKIKVILIFQMADIVF